MNISEIKKIASKHGVKIVRGMKKGDIIRAIQLEEGNFPCYGQAVEGECSQINCLWRKDCLKEKRKH
ncbi:Rho termination factor N-terminal domain-containing protein [bacterium]|nr:Rho termination factor N-terminal domain-containing protein [bacterium]